MFHKDNFGYFGKYLPCDMDGYVPEKGDKLESFNFPNGFFDDEEHWLDFVDTAITSIEEANQSLSNWRNEQNT